MESLQRSLSVVDPFGSPMRGKSDTEVLREENERLRRAVDELATLNELALSISSSFNSQEVIEEIIRRSVKAVGAEQATITLVDQQSPSEAKTLVRALGSSTTVTQFHMDQTLLGWIINKRTPLLSNDPAGDERLGKMPGQTPRSLLCVPLLAKSQLVGALTAYNKRKEQAFTLEDQRLLTIIAGQSAQVIENARLYEKEQALREVQEELRFARQIQIGLLPRETPEIPGYKVAGTSLPAREVGGDYFDTIPMQNERWALCLGDVSGKGLPASLLMANLQATLRAQAGSSGSVRDCVSQANRMLYRSTEPERFATLIYAVLDAQGNRICYCNAGHEPPFHFPKIGEPRRLSTGGMLTGFMEEASYEDECVELASGDFIFAYSDGVTDAENLSEEQFGEERLIEVLEDVRELDPEPMLAKVLEAVEAFAGEAAQFDDMTIIILKRMG
jgi:phosphoserine phosphatase RsbU/P